MASDLIDRGALLEDLRESVNWLHKIYGDLKYEDEKRICGAEIASFSEVILRVKDAPAVDAEPVRHGEWIDGMPYTNSHWKVCSVCFKSAHHPAGGDNFCPNCGAMMDGGKKDAAD